MIRNKRGSTLLESMLGLFITALLFVIIYTIIVITTANVQYVKEQEKERAVLSSVCESLINDGNHKDLHSASDTTIGTLLGDTLGTKELPYSHLGLTQDKTFRIDDLKQKYDTNLSVLKSLQSCPLENYDVSLTFMFSNSHLYRDFKDSDTIEPVNLTGESMNIIPIKVKVSPRVKSWENEDKTMSLFLNKNAGSLEYILLVNLCDYLPNA